MSTEPQALADFFATYKVINVSAFAQRIGMTQSLLSQYISGSKKLTDTQRQRIQAGLQQLSDELGAVQIAG